MPTTTTQPAPTSPVFHYVTLRECQVLSGIHAGTWARWCRDALIPAFKVGLRKWVVSRDVVDRVIAGKLKPGQTG